MNSCVKNRLVLYFAVIFIVSCEIKNSKPSKDLVSQLHLKKGEVISCGPPGKEFGVVDFEMNCSKNVKNDFNTALELLHSFEYDESEKVFAKIIDESPGCAMAYWGVAMANFHPLWEPPTEADIIKGEAAVRIAIAITGKSKRESGYIEAIAAYYKDWKKTNARIRAGNFEKAMQQLHSDYPDDPEAAIFYALSLDAAADPADKNYTNQKKAGDILNALYNAKPNHPGIIHYIIHISLAVPH